MPNAKSLTGKRRNDKPKPKPRKPVVTTDAPCDCCGNMPSGLPSGVATPIGCLDGALVPLAVPMPSEGSWVPVYTAGVGWTWVNALPLTNPAELRAPTPAEIPPAKDAPPQSAPWPEGPPP